jgi:hypothetical protein
MVVGPTHRKEHPMLYIAVVPASPLTELSEPPEPAAQAGLPPRHAETVARFFDAVQSGDYQLLHEILTPETITRWPQSGERITGALTCIRVYENYPGGSPKFSVQRVSGGGDVWVAEMLIEYGEDRWFAVTIFEFDGPRIARITDYFGPPLPAPAWREDYVDPT